MKKLATENISVTRLANNGCPQKLSYYFQHKCIKNWLKLF